MYATDGIYNGIAFSDYGCMICDFNSSSGAVISGNGGNLQFNLSKTPKTDKFNLYSSAYSDSCTAMFNICKSPLTSDTAYFTSEEVSEIKRWLCRRDGFYKFEVIQENDYNLFFHGSFNVRTITVAGQIAGMELTFHSNAPYGYISGYEIDCVLSADEPFTFYDISDEIGDTYPPIEITCLSSGDLSLTNSCNNTHVRIKNVREGEVIKLNMETSTVFSSVSNHDIASDFNYTFFKMTNTFENRENVITCTIPCELHIDYKPVRKIGVE